VAVTQRAADDTAQHVAAAFVAGITPSTIRKAAARMWSAITRSDLFSRSVAPVSRAAALISAWNRSIS
jgi:hypothetical protein